MTGAAAGAALGLQAATQYVAWTYRWATALGHGLALSDNLVLYAPWSLALWRSRFAPAEPQVFSAANALVLLGLTAGLGVGVLLDGPERSKRTRGWGDLKEAQQAGLLSRAGCIFGEMRGRVLATDDLRPTLVTGGTRSGKGRGHVVPTLLSWPGSAMVHDPKGELWRATAGWRIRFSHALFFNPRNACSARWNPLAEIRPGAGELAQVQRLVAILSDPGGIRDDEAIWDKAASEILEAVILHVLYSAKDRDKTLLKVRELLADLDEAADQMVKTLHRPGPAGEPETHPFIRTAVKGYAAMHDRFRTSVQGTARSYLKWLAGEDVERALSTSDFALGDLMCAEAPVSLYVQVAPADAAALKPLVRLLFYAAAQALTAHEATDASGRPKHHKLLMVMDEFPLLGRVEFFEKSLRLMSGYGLKAMFVAQSLNDIVETYGPNNTLLDNCFVYTAFSALDPLTQEKVSRLTGSITEIRTSRSGPAGLAAGRSSVSHSEVERPLLEPGEIRSLPDDEQLMFVAGCRPLRTRKLRYDRKEPFRSRANASPPDQAVRIDTPGAPPHPWAGRRALGEDRAAGLPLFKEVEAVIHDKKAAAKAAEIYGRVAAEMAAQEAALDQLQGIADG
ncbi:type IV secretory system conjugative DNA transfer family protein [Phenylobacterium sp.]|uniref:type IV secretory system conjugative DNA transfer family protein n=1 Tax=Phenylobacterium sp. TaxID=1871053 RepID=UPI002E3587D2|nr:type IV secretory system conjugative DNA transfer family protein [Phenylobacterium sp.]HEX4712534.1 type IV secretory system conjugative DNA transfer family protein [Phenylobacterium sp.]